jgi:DNA excision repair protein ERCC-5
MGVQGLWTVVQPCARPTNLSTLNRKRLAIDASIWIYQFLKAVRDKEGNALRNSHVVGFFRRICKLLWYGVKPVFVFDGGAPALKRATLQGRRRRREGRREDAARTAGKLLAVQMQRMAEEEEEKRRRRAAAASGEVEEEQEQLPSMDQIVYADELGMSKQERQKNRRFHKQDAYHLPELQNGIEGMGKPNDPRIMSVEELEEYARQFNNGEDINLYDFSKIDFDGEFFKSLPAADRYNILNAARIRSRLRMGLSKDQLDGMFPDRMAFSRFQIERVKERNHLTQRLMYEMGMAGTDLTMGVNRIAGDRNREYILVKNEGAEGGWALGVVSKDKDRGQIHKPIDVDALDFQYQRQDDEDEWEDEEFEDVPIEGLNRLPKLRVDDGDDALFVDNDNEASLFANNDILQEDEDEDLNRAIALSLQNQHRVERQNEEEKEDEEAEDMPAPEWKQKAVEPPRPIASTSGRMVAHIVNNRASAAVPRRRGSESSDSDVDLQAALAAARKKQPKAQPAPKPAPAPVKPNVKNPFDGPLPFEKLDWRAAFGGKLAPPAAEKPKKPQEAETGDLEALSDDEAGGFEKEPSEEALPEKKNDKPLPLPPWLTDDTDIRESVRKQQELERQMNEEAEEDRLQFVQGQDDVIEIESSSDDGSDIEILDAPPPAKQPMADMPGASLPSLEDDVAKESADMSVRASESVGPAAAVDKSEQTLPGTGAQREAQEKPVEPVAGESEDEEMEFEDVTFPTEPEQAAEELTHDAHMSEEARIEAELFGEHTPPPAQQVRTEGLASPHEDIDPDAPGPEEFEDFSDPEEEELLAQMAEEAEEHARFASQLNNKSQRENQEVYEQELRALRTQQKKDRRDADEVTQVMVAECQALLALFGIPYITAPMEAEAQCAELVRLNLVDGIVTDDSDTFLFGGTRVYKNMFNSNKYVECYLAKDLETELSLSREQLISLAQLLGSDYTEGLTGIGPVTALEILSEFPGGNDGLAQFRDWWHDVQQRGRPKEADADSAFRRKFRKSHATKLFLPLGFPNPAVVDAYLHPEVDSNPEPFQWGVPDLDGLRKFLMGTVGWSQERTDEVLVPVIRDMNKRDVEGTQSNITRFFGGAVGTGVKEAFAPRQRGAGGSKRMADAVSRLRARAGGGGGDGWEMPVAAPPGPGRNGGRKRKARGKGVVEGDDEEGNGDIQDEEVEDEGEDEDEGVNSKAKGKRKRNGGAAGKGKKSRS